ncbi:hypothetical protein PR002_g12150 [Phytophthora rubi]|uniref:Uncharacterized protein n=1 Tax=Phytophthora rubi TaxID=129364 RepID=A0A6A3LUD0_9STRA|nr:hypothetical protein PR002_g12150 [Phytophthora rubi]
MESEKLRQAMRSETAASRSSHSRRAFKLDGGVHFLRGEEAVLEYYANADATRSSMKQAAVCRVATSYCTHGSSDSQATSATHPRS